MANLELTQEEADAFIAMHKVRTTRQIWHFPNPGDTRHIPLVSVDHKHSFILDIQRGRIYLKKATFQNRVNQVVPLVRVDVGGRPHRNPDDVEVPSPHIHLYREGFGDKWAFPLPPEIFTDPSDLGLTLEQFMWYCNIVDPPEIQPALF
ncbi:MAG: hypothetical protein QOG00_323 [Pyrinomonadaceae bacterium]|nr:hypothetical protein [Pyrinomonadaceae bacterium]